MNSHVKHSPGDETGKGTYGDNHGKLTKVLLENLRCETLALVKSIPYSGGTFNIADYGTADGAAIMEFLGEVLTTLKQHLGQEVQFQVIYHDRPSNDFNSLFRRLYGLIQHPVSYLEYLDNIFPLAVGKDFYQQCVPSGTLHIIFSFFTVNWLSSRPTTYKNSIYMTPDCSDTEKRLVREQASDDWETFLLTRSKELKPGGLLVIAAPAEQDGAENNWSCKAGRSLPIMGFIWKQFVEDGRITQDEFENTNLDVYLRTEEELTKPFTDPQSPVRLANLVLVFKTAKPSRLLYYTEWERKRDLEGVDDRSLFANIMINTHKCFAYGAFMDGLSDRRSFQEKTELVDELFKCLKNEVMHRYTPDYFKNESYCVYLIIRKAI